MRAKSRRVFGISLPKIAEDVPQVRLDVKPKRVFSVDDIREAHRVMDANETDGKTVVVHS